MQYTHSSPPLRWPSARLRISRIHALRSVQLSSSGGSLISQLMSSENISSGELREALEQLMEALGRGGEGGAIE
jgi:hypothetical protein